MTLSRLFVTSALALSIATPAAAGDLRASAARAADEAAASAQEPARRANALTLAGAGLFAAGMAVGLYGFINDRNGEFSEFGEAKSSNKQLGAAGLSAAFAGGALMFLGQRRARHLPSVALGAGSVHVSKQITW